MVKLKIELPEGFLEEEERSGYLVSPDMKKVWAVELDLLAEFDRVCRENAIKYVMGGGSAIGAVRHKGFIPWDDDIDIYMLRAEYERLCEIAKEAFLPPYFWQTEYTDIGSLRGHAQLRNSDTTGIIEFDNGKNRPFNQGIFIDIFPEDNVVEDKAKLARQIKQITFLKRISCKVAGATNSFDEEKYRNNFAAKMFHRIAVPLCKVFDFERFFYHKMESVCKRYNKQEDTVYVNAFGFVPDAPRNYHIRKGMETPVYVDFEFLKVPLSGAYDEDLRRCFGDYMIFVKRRPYHGSTFFDTDRPYLEYTKSK
ncbi:MAG: LicD family protein [Blautia sp.]|nr:LicD family protein [Blautia sp.]